MRCNTYKYFLFNKTIDKPAMTVTHKIDQLGDQRWYLDGVLHRDDDLPASVHANGNKWWYRHGKLHRDGDLPAVEYANGNKIWYHNGLKHRDGYKSAIENGDGIFYIYKYGKYYTRQKFNRYWLCISRISRYSLGKIRLRRLMRVKWIHGELLCKPPKGNFLGGSDYHKMVGYFNKM